MVVCNDLFAFIKSFFHMVSVLKARKSYVQVQLLNYICVHFLLNPVNYNKVIVTTDVGIKVMNPPCTDHINQLIAESLLVK